MSIVNGLLLNLFSRFDYCGIAFLTVGSFFPWLYYSFYCNWKLQVLYLSIVISLGLIAVIVSTFDSFAGPRFRPLRAGTLHRVEIPSFKSKPFFNLYIQVSKHLSSDNFYKRVLSFVKD